MKTAQSKSPEGDGTGEIVDLLLFRLSDKGVVPSHVPGLVRDVLNIVKDDGHVSLDNVNQKLESLGWGEEILDEFVIELIRCLIERP